MAQPVFSRGASNIGGGISTVFQPIFQVRGRPIVQEKLLDLGMVFVFTILMLVIVSATTVGALLDRLAAHAPITAGSSFVIDTVVSMLAAFLLFFVLYAVFPNIEPRFKVGHVWRGALVASLLFQAMSFIWPLYAHFFHPQRFGAVLAPIVVFGVWIYFFALILVVGAEVVAFGALNEARAAGRHRMELCLNEWSDGSLSCCSLSFMASLPRNDRTRDRPRR